MTVLTSLPDDLVTRVRKKEISVADLSTYIGEDYYPRIDEVKKKFSGLNLDQLTEKELDILEFWYINAVFTNESERIGEIITKLKSEEYTKQLESARLVVWRSSMSRDYTMVKGIQTLLDEHREKDNMSPAELTDCKTPKEMREKIELYRTLSKDRLADFYNGQVKLFPIGSYELAMRCGYWENTGGIDLAIMASDSDVVHVGGKIHRGLTQILTIQGGVDAEERINQFKEEAGIHPANLTLLLFLKLSQHLAHEKITIRGSASHAYNYTNKNSAFYDIPRNYFRLRVNPQSGLYEFEGGKRDQLIDKFTKKSVAIADALQLMKEYLNYTKCTKFSN